MSQALYLESLRLKETSDTLLARLHVLIIEFHHHYHLKSIKSKILMGLQGFWIRLDLLLLLLHLLRKIAAVREGILISLSVNMVKKIRLRACLLLLRRLYLPTCMLSIWEIKLMCRTKIIIALTRDKQRGKRGEAINKLNLQSRKLWVLRKKFWNKLKKWNLKLKITKNRKQLWILKLKSLVLRKKSDLE